MSKYYYVYELSLPDGSKYIGLSINPAERFLTHISLAFGSVGSHIEYYKINTDKIYMRILSRHESHEIGLIKEAEQTKRYLKKHPLLNRKIKFCAPFSNYTKPKNGLGTYDARIANPELFERVNGKYQRRYSSVDTSFLSNEEAIDLEDGN
jgi:predicted GIY-YIG superfamily endonuclease